MAELVEEELVLLFGDKNAYLKLIYAAHSLQNDITIQIHEQYKYIYRSTHMMHVEDNLNIKFEKLIEPIIAQNIIRIIDLGCSDGTCLSELRQYLPNKVLLIGISIVKDPNWNHIDGVKFIPDRFENIASHIEKSSIDIIYSNFGITHAYDLPKVLYQCYRVLKPGGLLCFNLEQRVKGAEIPLIYSKEYIDSIKSTLVYHLRKK